MKQFLKLILATGNWSSPLQETFSKRTTTSDRHPIFFVKKNFSCVFASSQTQLIERDGRVHTEYTPWSVHNTLFRTPWLKIKLCLRKSQSHSHTRILILSLMSLLNVKFAPFPSLLSSPSGSSSRISTSVPNRTRSWCQSPDAPAR